MQEVFGFVKENLSRAKRRWNGRGEDGVWRKGAAVPFPASAHRDPGAGIALRPEIEDSANLA